jgi:glycosyltransferase involved in cell wall biosynthesis
MRIAVVTTSYPVHDGDPSGHFVQAEVRELEQTGHDVTVLRPRAGGAFGWPGAAARLRERPWRALDAGAWTVRAAAALRSARPERIVAHWCVPSAFPISLAGPEDAELEIVSHGGDIRLLRGLPRAARAMIVDRLLARAVRWRFVSEPLFADLLAALAEDRRGALERIAVVGASPLAMIDVREEARARRHAVGDRRLYVCAARLVASKRIDKVIDYVAAQRERDPILVIVGDGPERGHLERLAQRWMLDARFVGTLPRAEALSWIGAADEVVHASHAEGLSTVVREAEHLGVKVTFLT